MGVQGTITVVRSYSSPDVKNELIKRCAPYPTSTAAAVKAEAICRSVGLEEYLNNSRLYTVDMRQAIEWYEKNQAYFQKLAWLINSKAAPGCPERVCVSVLAVLYGHLDEYAAAVKASKKFSDWFDGVNRRDYDEYYTTPAQRKLFRTLCELNSRKLKDRISQHELASVLFNAWAFDCIIPMDESEWESEPSDEYLFTNFDFTEVM